MRHRVSKLLSTAATSILLAAANASVTHANELDQWTSWVEVGGFGGSDAASRGELVGFAPLVQTSDQLLFTELRGKAFEQDQQEGNFALGYRQMLSNDWNAGIWAGVDVRRTPTNTNFWQAAGGLELLHPDWDVRLNGYLPFNKEEIIARTQTTTPGSIILNTVGGLSLQHIAGSTTTSTVRELALWGIDGEVGARVPLEHLGLDKSHELRLFAGAYRFDHERLAEDIAGPRVRSEWRIADTFGLIPGSRLTLESEYSSDTVRDHRWEAGARLRIPLTFGKTTADQSVLSAQAARMTEALERDTDIVTSADTSTQVTSSSASPTTTMTENVIDNATNVTLTKTATATDPASLAAAVAQGAGTLIIVDGAGGTYNLTATSGQALNTDQTIVGGTGTLTLRGATTGTLFTYTAPGARPTLQSADGNPLTGVLTAGRASHIVGLNLQGAGTSRSDNIGIYVNTEPLVTIEQTDITDMGAHGILVSGNSMDITIRNNTIANSLESGIQINASIASRITINENTISGPGIDTVGISFIGGDALDLRITQNNVSAGRSLLLGGTSTSDRFYVTDNTLKAERSSLNITGTNHGNLVFSRNTMSTRLGDNVLIENTSNVNFTSGYNNVSNQAGLNLCSTTGTGGFTGTLSILEGGVLPRDFVNGC